MGIMITNWS